MKEFLDLVRFDVIGSTGAVIVCGTSTGNGREILRLRLRFDVAARFLSS